MRAGMHAGGGARRAAHTQAGGRRVMDAGSWTHTQARGARRVELTGIDERRAAHTQAGCAGLCTHVDERKVVLAGRAHRVTHPQQVLQGRVGRMGWDELGGAMHAGSAVRVANWRAAVAHKGRGEGYWHVGGEAVSTYLGKAPRVVSCGGHDFSCCGVGGAEKGGQLEGRATGGQL